MILVTGGTGLVGSHLLFELTSKGERVRALKRTVSDISLVKKTFSFYSPNPGDLFSKIEWVDGDVTDVNSLHEALKGIDIVYHCAGCVSYDPRDADRIRKINGEGTANVVNVCLTNNVKKLCHVSSVAAFGDVPENKTVTEEMNWKGCASDNYYSLSKYNAEREVWRGIAEGLNAVIVNPSVIVGPGNWNMSSCAIFKESYKGLWFYPNGAAGYVDVRDVARAMIRLTESEVVNERFILSAENLSFRDFANMVHEVLQKKKPSVNAGPFLLGMAWRLEKLRSSITGRTPVLTKTIAQAVNSKAAYSSDKLRTKLDYQFIPLVQSVKETAEIFLRDLKKDQIARF
ncbi:MAG TPA: NAD-dependent epimerase/dehydratase family protein [Bacteroidia bacterium]|jgi:nucleoside-diphosphate-sugar epimerase